MDPTEFILPLAGIALIVILVWLSGWGRLQPLDEATVRAALEQEGLNPGDIAIGRRGATALASQPDGAALLVRRMGSDTGVSLHEPAAVRKLEWQPEPPQLIMRFNGLAQAPFRIEFADGAALETWRTRLMDTAQPEGSD